MPQQGRFSAAMNPASVKTTMQQSSSNLTTLAKAHRYNGYIVDNVRRYLGDRVLDIGCGIGNTTAFLQRPFVLGIDTSESCLAQFRSRFPDIEARNIDMSRDDSVAALLPYRFDTIFSSNVIEHIEDDDAVLAHAYEVLVPGGVLALVLPNYPWLYSAQDEYVRHFRRYRQGELRSQVERAGFRSEASFCINFPGVFWWLLTSKLLRKRALSDWEPGLIDSVIPVVRLLDVLTLHSIGLSVVQIARKPG